MEVRRDFILPEEETEYLNASFPNWSTLKDGGYKWLILTKMVLPQGYTETEVEVAISIPTNYPAVSLDMVYFYPPFKRTDGIAIPNSEMMQPIAGRDFQRWSRHYASSGEGKWNPETDSVITHVMAIQYWPEREFERRK